MAGNDYEFIDDDDDDNYNTEGKAVTMQEATNNYSFKMCESISFGVKYIQDKTPVKMITF